MPPATGPVGPFMLQTLVDDLPLDTTEQHAVTVTCLESWGASPLLSFRRIAALIFGA